MNKRILKGLSILLSAGLLLSQAGSVVAVNDDERATKGLYITEIYNNDVDRNSPTTRTGAGYDKYTVCPTKYDYMEFVELTNTSTSEINLNSQYEISVKNGTTDPVEQTVENTDGTDLTLIGAGETVVIWNHINYNGTTGPDVDTFRKEMRVPQNVKIFEFTTQTKFAENNFTVTLMDKSTGKIQSEFTASPTTDKDTNDGHSVELSIPDFGYHMNVYRHHSMPSPGYVSYLQTNGQRKSKNIERKGLILSEIRPNDVLRKDVYGVSDDLMECIEVANNTDKDIDLNKEYSIEYQNKESWTKTLDIYQPDLQDKTCIVKANSCAVIWIYRTTVIPNIEKAGITPPSVDDFKSYYSIPQDIPVFYATNQSGLIDGLGLAIYKIENGTKNLFSYYSSRGADDVKDNRSVILQINPDSPEMLPYMCCTPTTMGVVDDRQLNIVADDGSETTLSERIKVPESINQGEELRMQFDVHDSKTLPRDSMSILYRFDGQGQWYKDKSTSYYLPRIYEPIISADKLFNHKYVEFFLQSKNKYNTSETKVYKVNINKLDDIASVRTNISDNQNIAGKYTVTANDGKGNENVSIKVDNQNVELKPVIENGAYYGVSFDGRDGYFKSVIATTDNEIIHPVSWWLESDDKALFIDNKYFTYNDDAKMCKTTMRFQSGTTMASFEDKYQPDANRDDLYLYNLKMMLSNGKVYGPTKIAPQNAETNTRLNLSTDISARHCVGDSAGMSPYLDVSFEIPYDELTAKGYEIDTTKMTDGAHTLVLSDGTTDKTVTFIVDNEKPVIDAGISEGSVLSGKIEINPHITDNKGIKSGAVVLDGKIINTPYSVMACELGKGPHKLEMTAEDLAGNYVEKTVNFVVADTDMSLSDYNSQELSHTSSKLSVVMDNKNLDGAKVDFYSGRPLDSDKDITSVTKDCDVPYIEYTLNVGDVDKADRIELNWNGEATKRSADNKIKMFAKNIVTGKYDVVASEDKDGKIYGSFVADNYVDNGKATVAVQCVATDSSVQRDKLDNPAEAGANADWDGTDKPKDYDFCFAWETDTQYYAEGYPFHYDNMNKWIVDNKDDWKIKYVIHTGDIVDDYYMDYEWQNADKSMKIFEDAKMPYGVLGGNHDVAAGKDINDNYCKYFGEDRFKEKDYYGGSYKNNLGHYDLISQNGQDFILLYMSWNVYSDEMEWMNNILKQYPDRKAIILLHSYTHIRETDNTYIDYFGKMIQKEVVAKNPNVIAVLNGHYHGSSYETQQFDDDGDGVMDRTVYQICTDYQSGFEGGGEYIKFLYFNLNDNKIYVNSYSPYYKDFNYFDDVAKDISADGSKGTDEDSYMFTTPLKQEKQTITAKSFAVNIKSSNKLGSVNEIKDGKASLIVDNIDSKADNYWYATVENNSGSQVETKLEKIALGKEVISQPTITEGQNKVIINVDDAKFRSDANIKDFVEVRVDGKIVDKANYTVTEGSTIITFKADFLKTLSVGNHTISIVSTTGEADTVFTVDKQLLSSINNDKDNNNDNTSEESKTQTTTEKVTVVDKKNKNDNYISDNPKTHAGKRCISMIILLGLTSSLALALVAKKKK